MVDDSKDANEREKEPGDENEALKKEMLREKNYPDFGIRAAYELVETVYKALPTGIVLSDASGQITYYSPGAERILEGPIPGSASGGLSGSYRFLRPDFEQYPENELPLVRAIHEECTISDIEMVVERGDSSRFNILASVAPIRDQKGRICGAGFQDVTNHQRAEKNARENEEKFRVLVEAASQAVWETDAEGNFISDSPAWRSYTGQPIEEWTDG